MLSAIGLRARWPLAGLGLLSGALLGAAAPVPHVHLIYHRDSGSERCPDDRELKAAISARLGDDPFVEEAPVVLTASVQRGDGGLHAIIDRQQNGRAAGHREITSSSMDCIELASALELALSVVIDPLAMTRRVPAVPVPTPPVPTPPIPTVAPTTTVVVDPSRPSPESPAKPVPVRPVFAAGIGILGALGSAPAPSVGPLLEAELRWPGWSLALDGRLHLPSGMAVGQGDVNTSVAAATLAPCLRFSGAGACVVGEAGAQWAAGQHLSDEHQWATPYAAVGARFFYDWSLPFRLAIRAQVEAFAPLIRTTLVVSDTPVWTTPVVYGALGVVLLVRPP
jgi:hypothetical protein